MGDHDKLIEEAHRIADSTGHSLAPGVRALLRALAAALEAAGKELALLRLEPNERIEEMRPEILSDAIRLYQRRCDAQVSDIARLTAEVEREKKSATYHCKESQRKNDRIAELEVEVERLRERNQWCERDARFARDEAKCADARIAEVEGLLADCTLLIRQLERKCSDEDLRDRSGQFRRKYGLIGNPLRQAAAGEEEEDD